MPAAAPPDPTTAPFLPGTVAWAATRFGDRPAFVDPDGTEVGYADLHRRSDEVAAGLTRRGIGEGDVVALTLPSVTAWVVAYVAAAKVGAVTAGVNPRLTAVEQAACLERVEPALVLATVDEVEALAVRGGTPDALAPGPDRPVAIVFTSGTTGIPKGAWFTDRQLDAVTTYDVAHAVGTPTRLIPQYGSTQFAHVGFTTKLPWYLRLGTTTHLLARWRPGDVLDLVERAGIETIGGVAPQVALLLRDPGFDQRDLSMVRLLVMGGAASPPALVQEARQRFEAAYSIRWSSTESGGVGTGTAPDAPDSEALHTVGRPRPGIGIQVRGADDLPLPHGEVGAVWIRSEASMSGYWRDPEATAETLVAGWLRTGDLGSTDASGLLTLAGRQGEMFIRGGYNVFPSEVSGVLASHPGVADAVVIPRPDDVLGEIGVAVVVPADPSAPPSLASLREHAQDRLAHHKLPEDVLVVDEIPLTAMQKVDRRRLSALVQEPEPPKPPI
ncbi:MAG TPA: AMP-binding protein [Acidimicrobiales bacterium]|nr:AMP-binding protein [Acidimicrobiales bacterium]